MLISRRCATLAITALVASSTLPATAQEVLGETGLKGAGSTFLYPVLSLWSLGYRNWQSRGGEFPAPNTGLDDPPASNALEYEPVGSLAGALRVKDRAVDFGASDMPMKSEELAALGLAQFPIVMGGVVVAINVDGVGAGQLGLTGPVLAEIFLGTISRWSDPKIKAHNPTLRLPDAPITVVRRSDGSGTTFNFTHYLSQVSPDWRLKAGSGLNVSWPTGLGAKGNLGLARAVQTTKNSIGYVEYAQATELGLSYASIQNRSGQFVKPGPASFQAAAASAEWDRARDFYVLLTNTASKDAYPITATVFALMHKAATSTRTGATLDFFRWSLEHGAGQASELGYVPLPPALVKQVTSYWATTLPR
jgi:phosphate transport system substrate-binding protein